MEASSDSEDSNLFVSLSCESSSYAEFKILSIFWKHLLLLRISLNITKTHTEEHTEKDDYDDENPDNSQLNNTDRYYKIRLTFIFLLIRYRIKNSVRFLFVENLSISFTMDCL